MMTSAVPPSIQALAPGLTAIAQYWLKYFHANTTHPRPIPWTNLDTLTGLEKALIQQSIQQFQLGESSEGVNLMRLTRRYADPIGDLTLVSTVKLFIGEEQRHSRELARFMNQHGIPQIHHHWTNMLFRTLRRLWNLEVTLSVLLTAEVVATLYYPALALATESPVLKALCMQIYRDESRHVEFQRDLLALLRPSCPRWQRLGMDGLYALFVPLTCLAVWLNHGHILRLSGYSLRRFYQVVAGVLLSR